MYRKSLGDGVKLLAHDLVLLFLLSITLKSAFIIKELDYFKSFGNRKEIIRYRNKKLDLYRPHIEGTNRLCVANWELIFGNV